MKSTGPERTLTEKQTRNPAERKYRNRRKKIRNRKRTGSRTGTRATQQHTQHRNT